MGWGRGGSCNELAVVEQSVGGAEAKGVCVCVEGCSACGTTGVSGAGSFACSA